MWSCVCTCASIARWTGGRYLVLFGLLSGTVCTLLTTHLPKIARQIVGVLLVAVQVLFAEVQLMYHAIFGNFMPISQVSMGGNVITNFDSQILYSIGKNIAPILLLLVPLIVTILCLALRKLRVLTVRLKWRQALATLGILLTLLLVAIGLLVLFSASYARAYYETKNAASVFVNQLIFAVMGIGVMWLISRVPYEWYQKLSLLILAASIGLLVLVPFIGTESGGATRWLDFGFVSFQPSEIAKFGVICSFAAIMAAHTRDMKTIRYGVAPYVVILGIIAVLLYLEPHMSATLIILALGFILMTLGGTDWKYLVGLVILGCLLVAVYLLTKGYTGGRISAWLHPENDPLDKGLQVLQSQYAIGSGGLLGLGFGRGRQKYLYLPEEHNDYIFAIACEELGFVGAIGILILFALLIIRGYWIAMHARDRFSMLLAAGLTTLLALQVFLNVAVVTNLLPSTGISLPFFSYGGTALIMQLAENGIVLNVSRSITQSPR